MATHRPDGDGAQGVGNSSDTGGGKTLNKWCGVCMTPINRVKDGMGDNARVKASCQCGTWTEDNQGRKLLED